VQLDGDWYRGGVPENVTVGVGVYIDTSYAFEMCDSEITSAIALGDHSGVYDRSLFIVGAEAQVVVGAYSCLNGVTIVANDRVEIGAHCLLAWGSVLTDSPSGVGTSLDRRRAVLATARATGRPPPLAAPRPLVLERNVWVGFDSVVGPGLTVGEGSIVGCKSLVTDDVPKYSVVVGNPARVIATLDPSDAEDEMHRASVQVSLNTSAVSEGRYLTGIISDRAQRRSTS
jgi:acetyltransferase-like isoleucine patch superfamily enzyme